MAAGIIDHETGTRDIRRLSGLFRLMPVTAALAMVAAASMAGVPLLNGFLSKEMFFAETIAYHVDSVLDDALPYLVTIAAMFSVTYSLRFIHGGFFGPPTSDLPRMPPPLPSWMILPVAFLVSACLLVGILPAATAGPLLETAVRSVLGSDVPSYSLRVWHGFTFPLLMSVAALAGGLILYRALQPYLRETDGPLWLPNVDSLRLFDRFLVFLSWRAARAAVDFFGTRRLQTQLRILVIVAILAAGWPIYRQGLRVSQPPSAIDPLLAIIWVIGAVCAAAAAYFAKYHRLAALICMSGAGLAVCITFAWFSAPDLALTQFLVEIVTGVLLLLGLRWLPKRLEVLKPEVRPRPVDRLRRASDALIAMLAGCGIAAIAYAALTRPLPDSISRFFLERAYTEGGGTNVINVILVDFRAFDTLGEITVLGVVALTVYALLRRFRPATDSVQVLGPRREQAPKAESASMVPSLLIRILFPFILMAAIYLLLRGHNLPGGGFVAGLTVSVAIILQYMAGGIRWAESRLLIRPVHWIGLGLLGAALTGIGACLAGYPFLTSYFAYRDVPLLGRVPLSSALLFDLGVFVLVVGATVLVLVALAHQSIRSHRPARIEADPAAGERRWS
jgi:multicomponent K+:H+ antiporter subunit A